LHTADVDVVAALDVLAAMVGHYPVLSDLSLADLHTSQARAHHDWATNFNDWLARKGRTPDVNPTWI
jgi:DNA polymerase-3 subunit epsilon